jgi:hypothetical protein
MWDAMYCYSADGKIQEATITGILPKFKFHHTQL